ncbi:MAG TPA: TniB family NTP-binding protein [Trinickia sp.]
MVPPTSIIAKFLREHPPVFDELHGIERRQIIALQMPPTPDQARFYRALLFELGVPQAALTTLGGTRATCGDLLRRLAPRMLVVDEVHHLLAGSYREHRASLNLLKDLANDLRLSIVAVGTDDAPAFSS